MAWASLLTSASRKGMAVGICPRSAHGKSTGRGGRRSFQAKRDLWVGGRDLGFPRRVSRGGLGPVGSRYVPKGWASMLCSRRRFPEISVRPGRKPDFGSLSSGSIKPPIGYWLGPLAFTQEERVRFPLGRTRTEIGARIPVGPQQASVANGRAPSASRHRFNGRTQDPQSCSRGSTPRGGAPS